MKNEFSKSPLITVSTNCSPNTPYNHKFFDSINESSIRSASVVVPLVMQLLKVESVIDIGCGLGAWLEEFHKCGATILRGIDGSYVDQDQLLIAKSQFAVQDLGKSIVVKGNYDLAISLEVAEHLPSCRAKDLVRALANAAPAIMFSAAVPGQGGTHHVNEQWHCYWHKQFAQMNYDCFDLLRPRLFACNDVAWWYRQNLFLYAARGSAAADMLARANASGSGHVSPIASHVLVQFTSVSGLFSALRSAVWRAIKNRFVRFISR